MLHDSFLSFCIFCFSVRPTDGKCSNNPVEVARETGKSVIERANEVKESVKENVSVESAREVAERGKEQVSERAREAKDFAAERAEEISEIGWR